MDVVLEDWLDSVKLRQNVCLKISSKYVYEILLICSPIRFPRRYVIREWTMISNFNHKAHVQPSKECTCFWQKNIIFINCKCLSSCSTTANSSNSDKKTIWIKEWKQFKKHFLSFHKNIHLHSPHHATNTWKKFVLPIKVRKTLKITTVVSYLRST